METVGRIWSIFLGRSDLKMAYLVLVICLVYALLWGAGLAFALRSDGQKAIWVPVLGLLVFVGGSAFSAMSVQHAIENPPTLTEASYTQLQLGMNIADVQALLGEPQPEDKEFDLRRFSIKMPGEISSRLRGERFSPASDALLVIAFSGEPTRANLSPRRGEGLGRQAIEENNGVMGLEIAIRENGNELKIVEGVDWEYETDMTDEHIAAKFAELIDASDAWHAENPEDKPKQVIIKPELPENAASVCNTACSAQVLTGPNSSIKVRGIDNGSEMQFRGGEDEAFVKYWYEEGILMDADFSSNDKLVVVGFIAGESVEPVQAGIDIEEEITEEAEESAE
jgi:hypothetical protein